MSQPPRTKMNKTYALPEDDLSGEFYRRIYLLVSGRRGGWKAAGAAFGLAGGVLSIALALSLWAAARFLAPASVGPALNLLSNVFFALPLPLLALGACCLDLLEKHPRAVPTPAARRHQLRLRHSRHN